MAGQIRLPASSKKQGNSPETFAPETARSLRPQFAPESDIFAARKVHFGGEFVGENRGLRRRFPGRSKIRKNGWRCGQSGHYLSLGCAATPTLAFSRHVKSPSA